MSLKNKIIAGLILFTAGLGLCLASSHLITFFDRFSLSWTRANQEITEVLFSQDCKVVLETTAGKAAYNTDYHQDEKCLQYMLASISESNKFAAYKDRSGGLDSKVQVYAAGADKSVLLDVYGTSEIYDLAFLVQDCLAVLNGYQSDYDELFLQIYDVGALFEDYPHNVEGSGQYVYFQKPLDSKLYKSINLPDVGEGYDQLEHSDGFLEIYGAGSTSREPLIRYKIDDLCSFP